MHHSPTSSGRGFTLVELLVVLGIIMILLSLLLPALASARASARALRCAEQMRGYGVAMAAYANDFNGYLFPPVQWPPTRVEVWAEPVFGTDLVWRDAANGEYSWLLVCPDDPYDGNPDPRRPSRNSYLLNSVIVGKGVRHQGPMFYDAPSEMVVMGEKRPEAVGWMESFCYSIATPDPHWYDEIDLVRHGSRRSNHLFLDLHVDNDEILSRLPEGWSGRPWLFWGQ